MHAKLIKMTQLTKSFKIKMTKASTFSAIAAAVVALFSLASCDNSPKADNSTEEKKQVPSTIKIAYVEVDSIMTQYEFCKEYSLILEKKSQNIRFRPAFRSRMPTLRHFRHVCQPSSRTRQQNLMRRYMILCRTSLINIIRTRNIL